MGDSSVISLAYSVDADDAFMFYALREGRIDTHGLTFTHMRDHTAALNALAAAEGADVVAISAGAYPLVAGRYQLLPHGASVGRGFGPVVVARRPARPEALAGKRVAIPGATTTAWLVFRLMQPAAVGVEVPIVPFSRVFEALEVGEVDAALLIHEGRLTFRERGLYQIADLGAWWLAESGLPLPLGVNVIRRGLGEAQVARVSAVLRESIAWALANRDEIISAIAGEERGDKSLARRDLLDEYLNLYANEDTAAMADDARGAVGALFARARAAGLLGAEVALDWSP